MPEDENKETPPGNQGSSEHRYSEVKANWGIKAKTKDWFGNRNGETSQADRDQEVESAVRVNELSQRDANDMKAVVVSRRNLLQRALDVVRHKSQSQEQVQPTGKGPTTGK